MVVINGDIKGFCKIPEFPSTLVIDGDLSTGGIGCRCVDCNRTSRLIFNVGNFTFSLEEDFHSVISEYSNRFTISTNSVCESLTNRGIHAAVKDLEPLPQKVTDTIIVKKEQVIIEL